MTGMVCGRDEPSGTAATLPSNAPAGVNGEREWESQVLAGMTVYSVVCAHRRI